MTAEGERSCSRCTMRMVKGLHRFTLERYSLCKGVGWNQAIYSGCFTVGEYQWSLAVYPDRAQYASGGVTQIQSTKKAEGGISLGIYVGLESGSNSTTSIRCLFSMTLLDQSGAGNHITKTTFGDDGIGLEKKPMLVAPKREVGFPCIIERTLLENSPYLMYDCLKIDCTLGVLLPPVTIKMDLLHAPSISGCECDDEVGADLLALLETGEGSDVVFNVSGETFHAHKVILSARSSVFASMLSDVQQNSLTVTGIEPRVFKVLLHFVYSDTLPKDKYFTSGYAFGPSVSSTLSAKLLAAADEYDLKGLKAICESHIWSSISLKRFAETLALAYKFNASRLKNLCFEYANENFTALMELDTFMCLRKNYPMLYRELDSYLSKQRTVAASVENECSGGKEESGHSRFLCFENVDPSGRR